MCFTRSTFIADQSFLLNLASEFLLPKGMRLLLEKLLLIDAGMRCMKTFEEK